MSLDVNDLAPTRLSRWMDRWIARDGNAFGLVRHAALLGDSSSTPSLALVCSILIQQLLTCVRSWGRVVENFMKHLLEALPRAIASEWTISVAHLGALLASSELYLHHSYRIWILRETSHCIKKPCDLPVELSYFFFSVAQGHSYGFCSSSSIDKDEVFLFVIWMKSSST